MVVVGAGPNGLAAAIRVAEAGRSVLVVEAASTPGGGTRTQELTRPGFRHDVCSAVHPLGFVSPAFTSMPLADHGLEWLHAEVEAAHPLDDGTAGVLLRDMAATDEANDSGGRWSRLVEPMASRWPAYADGLLGPALAGAAHPLLLAPFAVRALLPATTIAGRLGERGGAVFAGFAAHSMTSLSRPLSSVAGLVFAAVGHVGGMPIAKGGSAAITDALASYLRSLGGEIEVGHHVRSIDELPPSAAVMFDMTPAQVLEIAGDRVPSSVARRWRRFRPGAASFKLDYALDGPVPWTSEAARRTVTLHLGGTAAEVAASEHDVWSGRVPDRPFVLVSQPSVVDPTRAPGNHHTLWAYCHLPYGSDVDMTDAIEAQIDRFAPGWRDRILARVATDPAGLAASNPNYRGGDISGGAADGFQVLFRPDASLDPYRVGRSDLWICSSSTPPGAGVHGICGDRAARSVLRALAG
ncbi:MAG TPA: NAD(P)/FAD-dependent oxidoreductase [Iamia sp.]